MNYERRARVLAAFRASSKCLLPTQAPLRLLLSCRTPVASSTQPFIKARELQASARACKFHHAPEQTYMAAPSKVAVLGAVATCLNFNARTLKLLTGHLYAMVVSLQPSASAFQVYTEAYCFQKPHCPRNYSCIRFHLTQVSSAHGDVPTNSYFVLPPSHGKGTAISPTSEPIRAQDRRRCFWSPRGSQHQSNTWKPDGMLPSGEGAGIQGVRRRLRLQPATRAVLRGGGGCDGSPRGT